MRQKYLKVRHILYIEVQGCLFPLLPLVCPKLKSEPIRYILYKGVKNNQTKATNPLEKERQMAL